MVFKITSSFLPDGCQAHKSPRRGYSGRNSPTGTVEDLLRTGCPAQSSLHAREHASIPMISMDIPRCGCCILCPRINRGVRLRTRRREALVSAVVVSVQMGVVIVISFTPYPCRNANRRDADCQGQGDPIPHNGAPTRRAEAGASIDSPAAGILGIFERHCGRRR